LDEVIARPEEVLPHRSPFLFLDEVTRLDDDGARGTWRPDSSEPFWAGHFPGRPTLPGVLMVEALAQLGAYAVLAEPVADLDGSIPGAAGIATKLPLFGGIDRARFRRSVAPGETLELEVTLGRRSARAGRGSGRASVDGETACEADLLFVLVDP
jgi:3-hydroxyacyl-[acyl-carrier-protein] dehydratase